MSQLIRITESSPLRYDANCVYFHVDLDLGDSGLRNNLNSEFKNWYAGKRRFLAFCSAIYLIFGLLTFKSVFICVQKYLPRTEVRNSPVDQYDAVDRSAPRYS